MDAQPVAPTTIDLTAVKARQQVAWASGDYAVIGTTLQIVGEQLAETCDLGWDNTVLYVAAGNGNATLAAARRGSTVTSTDYVSALLDRGAERAAAERLDVAFQVADAEALPFADASFDAVVSTFGVMFSPNQATAATEMAPVCRPGGRIGLTNWTPEGFIGQLFRTLARHLPAPAGVPSPSLWGRRVSCAVALRRFGQHPDRHAAGVHVPLPFARALHRRLPDVVRPGAQLGPKLLVEHEDLDGLLLYAVRRHRRGGVRRLQDREPMARRSPSSRIARGTSTAGCSPWPAGNLGN